MANVDRVVPIDRRWHLRRSWSAPASPLRHLSALRVQTMPANPSASRQDGAPESAASSERDAHFVRALVRLFPTRRHTCVTRDWAAAQPCGRESVSEDQAADGTATHCKHCKQLEAELLTAKAQNSLLSCTNNDTRHWFNSLEEEGRQLRERCRALEEDKTSALATVERLREEVAALRSHTDTATRVCCLTLRAMLHVALVCKRSTYVPQAVRRSARMCGIPLGTSRGFLFSSHYDWNSSGVHDVAPRDEIDFTYAGPRQVLPGAHPLPLYHPHNSVTRPPVSPYLPSPQRPHPYFTQSLPELPHFAATHPIVYTVGTMKEPIVVPVFNRDNVVTHTRELDPFIFGFYPEVEEMSKNLNYWLVRCQSFTSMWDYETREIWRKAKKNWPNTGMGLARVSDRKNHQFIWGGRTRPSKPWNMLMPTMDVKTWSKSNRMLVTLKMLQGKLQIVDRLTLPTPTQEAYLELCRTMDWDVRHNGGGVLFMDGGSRLTPSSDFDRSFFLGSFFSGRNKVVRPTLLCDEPYDYNHTNSKLSFRGPKGQKNPIPINRFNAYDALTHDLLVITEGAVAQLEEEMFVHKLMVLPPHIRAQLAERGVLQSEVLGDVPPALRTVQMEAAARTEEAERAMYVDFTDDPYQLQQDESDASYSVDATDGKVRRYVGSKKTSWAMLT